MLTCHLRGPAAAYVAFSVGLQPNNLCFLYVLRFAASSYTTRNMSRLLARWHPTEPSPQISLAAFGSLNQQAVFAAPAIMSPYTRHETRASNIIYKDAQSQRCGRPIGSSRILPVKHIGSTVKHTRTREFEEQQ